MIKRREARHRNVVNPTIAPLVGEHPHTKRVRDAAEASARIEAKRAAAASAPVPEKSTDRIITSTRLTKTN
jgi:hypothetical protein